MNKEETVKLLNDFKASGKQSIGRFYLLCQGIEYIHGGNNIIDLYPDNYSAQTAIDICATNYNETENNEFIIETCSKLFFNQNISCDESDKILNNVIDKYQG